MLRKRDFRLITLVVGGWRNDERQGKDCAWQLALYPTD